MNLSSQPPGATSRGAHPSPNPVAALPNFENGATAWQRALAAWRHGGLRGLVALMGRGPNRRLRLTQPGRLFFMLMAVIVLIGYVTGNNLLFLLFAAMLSLMVASGVLSEWAVRDVYARRVLPERVFATVPAPWSFELTNRSGTAFTFALEVAELDCEMVGETPYVVLLPPGRSDSARGQIRFEKRGRQTLAGIEIRTQFPFLLFTKVKTVDLPGEVIVLPPPAREVEVAVEAARDARETETARPGEGDEVAYVREAVVGESPRLIHWKKTAQVGRFVAKSFQSETSPSVLLRLEGSGGNVEPGLATLARLAMDLDQEHIATALEFGQHRVAEGRGPAHVTEMLHALALYEERLAQVGDDSRPLAEFPPHRVLRVEAHDGRVHLPGA